MRLTLRTMLANMCGLLEPVDAKELDQKIQGSQIAAKLAKRIPGLVNKRELDSPRLDAKAAYGDPNSVAEYLDGLLSPERTAEFDRVCLKSDVRLAEVASCFEILSFVHKKRSKVKRSVRQRMYGIGTPTVDDASDSAPSPNELDDVDARRAALFEEYEDYEAPLLRASQDQEAVQEEPPVSAPEVVKQPLTDSESLQQPASEPIPNDSAEAEDEEAWFEPQVVNQLSSGEPSLVPMIDVDGTEEDQPPLVEPEAPPLAQSENEDSADSSEPIEQIRIDTSGASKAMSDAIAEEMAEPPTLEDFSSIENSKATQATQATESNDQDIAIAPQVVLPAESDSKKSNRIKIVALAALVLVTIGFAGLMFGPISGPRDFIAGLVDQGPENYRDEDGNFEGPVVVDQNEDAVIGDGDTEAATSDSELTADKQPGAPTAPSEVGFLNERAMLDEVESGADQPNEANPNSLVQPDALVGNEAGGTSTDVGLPDSLAGDGPMLSEPLPMGKVVSEDQLLAYFNDEKGSWFRIRKDALIENQQLLMAFPLSRPRIDVGDSFSIVMLGAAGVQVQNALAADVPAFAVPFGSLLIKSRAAEAKAVQFDFGSVVGKLNLLTPNTRIALRQFNYLEPGLNPLSDTADAIVDLVCLEGRAAWNDGNSEVSLDPGQSIRYVNGTAFEPAAVTTSPFWTEEQVKGIEEMAVVAMDEFVDYDQEIERQFENALRDSRVEVRILAGQGLSLLGNHVPSVEALNEVLNKSFWSEQVAWLRAVAARGPSHAQTLEETFLYVNRKYGNAAFRLLTGFSEVQLEEGYSKELVESLLSEDLMVRVLAIDNLLRITGTRLLYRPESSDRFRQRYYDKWETKLNEGGVKYRTPPGPPSINGIREGE